MTKILSHNAAVDGSIPTYGADGKYSDGCKGDWRNGEACLLRKGELSMGRWRINQTLVQTATGIWSVAYNADNRPITFTNNESNTVVECTYDHLGRRDTKKVTVGGSITLHQRYLYRGYLQIDSQAPHCLLAPSGQTRFAVCPPDLTAVGRVAASDLRRSGEPCLWHITWDPTQETATRPLSIRKDGTWYCYGWDLTKNVCEVFKTNGGIGTTYAYTPYGLATTSGSITQPLQWSSEYADSELALVYYNYRHYNPTDGRWLSRDGLDEKIDDNLYAYVNNNPCNAMDYIGLEQIQCMVVIVWGHGTDVDEYINVNYQNYDPATTAFGPFGCYVDPSPAGYEISGFPNLQNSYLGDRDRGAFNNKRSNAGLNPNNGKTLLDRQQGFARALDKALKSAQKEAKKICDDSCCESIKVIFMGIEERSGDKGTKELRRRLKNTDSRHKNLTSYEERNINCPKKI